MLLSPAFGLPSINSQQVEDLKDEYRRLDEVRVHSPSQRKRLKELREELSDIPDWTRETEVDRRQTQLLGKIEAALQADSKV